MLLYQYVLFLIKKQFEDYCFFSKFFVFYKPIIIFLLLKLLIFEQVKYNFLRIIYMRGEKMRSFILQKKEVN